MNFLIYRIVILWQALLPDGGQRYTETDFTKTIVEPWNAVSAALFIIIVIYWLFRLKGKYQQHPFFMVVLPLLAIGAIGGTLYHAFRNSAAFLVMDWLPILLLCLCAGFYFLTKVLGSWKIVLIATGLVLITDRCLYEFFPPRIAVNTSYLVLAAYVLLSTWLHLKKNQYVFSNWVAYSFMAFSLAILFRFADPWVWLPMGTHFLWHIFGALACFLMLTYLYKINTLTPSIEAEMLQKTL